MSDLHGTLDLPKICEIKMVLWKIVLLFLCGILYISIDAVIIKDYIEIPKNIEHPIEPFVVIPRNNQQPTEPFVGIPKKSQQPTEPFTEIQKSVNKNGVLSPRPGNNNGKAAEVKEEDMDEPAMVYYVNQMGDNTHLYYLNGKNATTEIRSLPSFTPPQIPSFTHPLEQSPSPPLFTSIAQRVPQSHPAAPQSHSAEGIPPNPTIYYQSPQSPEDFIRLANEYFLKRNQHNFAVSTQKPHYAQPARHTPKKAKRGKGNDKNEEEETNEEEDGDDEDGSNEGEDEEEGEAESEERPRQRSAESDETRSSDSDETAENDSRRESSEEERPRAKPKPPKRSKPKHSSKNVKLQPPPPPPLPSNGYEIYENPVGRYVTLHQPPPPRVRENFQSQPQRILVRRLVPRAPYGPVQMYPLLRPNRSHPPSQPQFMRIPPALYASPGNRAPQRFPYFNLRPVYRPYPRTPNYSPVMPAQKPPTKIIESPPAKHKHGHAHGSNNDDDDDDNENENDEDSERTEDDTSESESNENNEEDNNNDSSNESTKKHIHRAYNTKQDAADGNAKEKHKTTENHENDSHNRHKSGFEKTNGSKFNRENRNRKGFKTNEGFDTYDSYGRGKNKAYDEKHHSENHEKTNSEHDASSGETAKHAENKSDDGDSERNGGKFNEKKSHKKGSKTLGYHNVFHKEEYKKVHIFYDDADHRGSFKKHGELNDTRQMEVEE